MECTEPQIMYGFIKEESIAIHCKSKEEITQLVDYLEKNTDIAIDWNHATTCWRLHGDKSCFDVFKHALFRSGISYYKTHGYEIVEFTDIFAEDEDLRESDIPLEYLISLG